MSTLTRSTVWRASQREKSSTSPWELANPATRLAVQIQTTDYQMIGWAPRYLVRELAKAMAEKPRDYAVRVVQVNPLPQPSKQRGLIEMRGKWDGCEPMEGDDYRRVVVD